MRGPPKKREVSVVILDIEGTTTPITFVRDNLFGFVREHLLEYVQTQGPTNPSVLAAMTHYGAPDAPSLVPSILSAMDRDEKTPALKRLQSDIMDSGWKDGSLQAVVYDDVVTSLRNWSQTKTSVAIYSSGAISAQKALYGHVKGHGSLLHLLAAHYDPATVGPKTQAASYAAIKALWGGNTNRNQILFLTDNPQEASAAVEAGLFCVLVSRPGNAELPQFPPVSVIQSFDVLWDMYEFVPTKSEAME
jgi:enolase-phosphatase E1